MWMLEISFATCFATDSVHGKSSSACFSRGRRAVSASVRSTRLSTVPGAAGLRIVLTDAADRDLDGITWFTLENFGVAQADRYIEGLRTFLKELVTHPHRLRRI